MCMNDCAPVVQKSNRPPAAHDGAHVHRNIPELLANRSPQHGGSTTGALKASSEIGSVTVPQCCVAVHYVATREPLCAATNTAGTLYLWAKNGPRVSLTPTMQETLLPIKDACNDSAGKLVYHKHASTLSKAEGSHSCTLAAAACGHWSQRTHTAMHPNSVT
jgi:hypothetical protein